MSTHPCDSCPWRVRNQGTKHPEDWYTRANLRFLWSKLRMGEKMSCHKTDPRMEGVPAGVPLRECSGGAILQQREFMRLQRGFVEGNKLAETLKRYRLRNPRGISKQGAEVIVARAVAGPLSGHGGPLPQVNLNEPEIGHIELVPWDPATEGK
jgi:hypothetical protein